MKKAIVFFLAMALGSPCFGAVPELKFSSTNRQVVADINVINRFDSTDRAMVTAPCRIKRIVAIPTSDNGSFVLYDNATAASGTVIEDIAFTTIATSDNIHDWTGPKGMFMKAKAGVYLDTTNCGVRIYYERG